MTPAAAYLRVSSERQDHANQRPEVLRLAAAREYDVTGRVYEETESSAKARPVHAALMDGARRGEFRAVVFWSLDRFGRTMWDTVRDVKELDRLGVSVVSVREPWFDTSGPVRDLLLAIFAWVANHERDRLRERTRAGLERARAQGKRLGRAPLEALPDAGQVAALRAQGLGQRRIAAALGCSVWAVRRVGS